MTHASVSTVQDVDPACKYHFEPPFLILHHIAEDIGLVGWNDRRWKHQDKVKRRQAPRAGHATDWRQAFDPDKGQYYFYNHTLNISTWEAPTEGFVPDDTVAYYVKAGTAQPWEAGATARAPVTPKPSAQISQHDASSQSARENICAIDGVAEVAGPAHRQALTAVRDPGQAAMAQEPSQAKTAQQEPLQVACAAFMPACVRFSPKKKGDLQPEVERYWITRYSLFSRWNNGVCLNESSLFSVTPEVIAKHHARMLRGAASVLDAFCGCGGNTIQLAACLDKVRALQVVAKAMTALERALHQVLNHTRPPRSMPATAWMPASELPLLLQAPVPDTVAIADTSDRGMDVACSAPPMNGALLAKKSAGYRLRHRC
jgi:hypothetical protein